MSRNEHSLPIAIIGSGPTGLDAALACIGHGLPCVVLEQDDAVGAGVRAWGHVDMFTPWSMNLSDRMRAAMRRAGIPEPEADRCPTGEQFVKRCLAPLAAGGELGPVIRTGTRVLHVAREGVTKEQEIGAEARARRPFRLIVSRHGQESVLRASAVVDCSGSRAVANSLGDGGVPAPGERAHGDRIDREIPDVDGNPADWSTARVLLVGAGHSAQTAARSLLPLLDDGGGHLTWVTRDPEPDWGAVQDDPLGARAALTRAARRIARGGPAVTMRRGAVVEDLRRADGGVLVGIRNGAAYDELEVDRVLALTGRVGDHTMYRQLQVHECYATAGPMSLAATLLDGPVDCLAQPEAPAGVLRNPEPGFFLAGAKSYGRNSRYLLSVGYSQVDEILNMIGS